MNISEKAKILKTVIHGLVKLVVKKHKKNTITLDMILTQIVKSSSKKNIVLGVEKQNHINNMIKQGEIILDYNSIVKFAKVTLVKEVKQEITEMFVMTIFENIKQLINHLNHVNQLEEVSKLLMIRRLQIQLEEREQK